MTYPKRTRNQSKGVWDALTAGLSFLLPLLVAFVAVSGGFSLKSHLISVPDMVTLEGEANASC